ncbi:unnamed protein product [Parnassius mnemosyne]|uniref:Reverse transcriptase domain-containing protein n=1 Tax=Parnassius mnemosyne TaxID=213953 RepID=A0AAV1LY10_9NEOP
MPQRSTEDALYDTMTVIRQGNKEKIIVVVVSLDIEGAFDNAWCPQIITEMKKKRVYADDILVIAKGHSVNAVEEKLNPALERIVA